MAIDGRAVIQGYFPVGLSHLQARHSVSALPRVAHPALAARPLQFQPGASAASGSPPLPGRNTLQQKAVRPSLPPYAGNVTVAPLPPNLMNFNIANATGQPLPPPLRQKMEAAFSASFADVRVHVTPQATLIGALAFTQGNNLYFAPGQYNPHTPQGQKLLAHELTHVVQQRAGRVRNPQGSGPVVVQNASLEAEAERMAQRMAFVQPPSIQSKPAGTTHPSPPTVRAIQLLPRRPNAPAFLPSLGVLQLASSAKKRYCKSHGAVTPNADNTCPYGCGRTNANPPAPQPEVKAIARVVGAGGGGGAAPAAAAPAQAPVQAPVEDSLTSTIYLWESPAWTSRGTHTANLRGIHAEVKLYQDLGGGKKGRHKKKGQSAVEAPEKDSWIGFKQNAWPCKSGHCMTFFTERSNKYNFVFNVTGDHGQYAKEHDKDEGATGILYIYNQNSYYAKADLPAGTNAPDPPA